MRLPTDTAAEEAPPPPYTAYEADQAVTAEYEPPESAEISNLPLRLNLRGGNRPGSPIQGSEDSHISSLSAYFEERRFVHDHAGPNLDLLDHNIHFDHGFTPTRLPFPRPSDAYLSRDITGQDWAAFVNCLYPIHEENREDNPKARSAEKRQHADHSDSPVRRERIKAVIAEWNVGFFAPRFIRVIAHFESPSTNRSPGSLAPEVAPYGRPPTSPSQAGHSSLEYFEPPSTSRSPGSLAPEVASCEHPVANPSQADPSGLEYFEPSSLDRSSSYLAPELASYQKLSAIQSQVSPSSLESQRNLRRSGSISSISSSSSSSSESSVDSIKSKDLDHATVNEIRAILDTFRADPHKQNHLHKSVKEFRHRLRTQHLPFSSSDPYNTRASKDEKKAFKEQRKTLIKEIHGAIKEAKLERKAQRKFRKASRKNRKEARKQERRERTQLRREEKHARRDGKLSKHNPNRGHNRELQLNPQLQGQEATRAFTSNQNPTHARAAYTRTASWGVDHVAAARNHVQFARTRSYEAVEAARQRVDAAKEAARERVEAVRESARQAGQQARDTAVYARRRGSNAALTAVTRASDSAHNVSRRVSDRAEPLRRQSLASEGRTGNLAAQSRADDGPGDRDWDAEGKAWARSA